MRGADITQHELFSYRTLEDRIPPDHPLRKLRAVVDSLRKTMDAELVALYAKTGRPSIPPERLLRASLNQVLFSIRSERQLVQQIDYNLLYRWFVGLTLDGEVWDHSTFSANRERLLNERISQCFFERVLALAEWQQLLSESSLLGYRVSRRKRAWLGLEHRRLIQFTVRQQSPENASMFGGQRDDCLVVARRSFTARSHWFLRSVRRSRLRSTAHILKKQFKP